MLHPEIAAIDCQDCCKRAYQLDPAKPGYGKPQTYRGGPERKQLFYEGAHYAPVCLLGVKCPKGTVYTAHESELSPRNQSFVAWWMRIRLALNQFDLDELDLQNGAIIEAAIRQAERSSLASSVASAIIPLLVESRRK